MPRLIFILCAALLFAGLVWLVLNPAQVAQWAALQQRDFQKALARALRALKSGDGTAWFLYLAMCFGYGFVHAVGPGHGKFLVGAYGVARDVHAARLMAVSAIASLGQGVMAIALVAGGASILNLSRNHLTDLTEQRLAPVSMALIGVIGLWLLWRGIRRLWRIGPVPAPSDVHGHDADHICPDCGHAHAPGPHAIAAAAGWRDMAAMIAGIAIRPCSGAVLLLVLTWQMGVFGAGIWGAFAMAVGTACLTSLVALASVTMRRGAMAGIAQQTPILGLISALFELGAGFAIVLITAMGLGLV